MNWEICCLFSIGNGAILQYQLYKEKKHCLPHCDNCLYALLTEATVSSHHTLNNAHKADYQLLAEKEYGCDIHIPLQNVL